MLSPCCRHHRCRRTRHHRQHGTAKRFHLPCSTCRQRHHCRSRNRNGTRRRVRSTRSQRRSLLGRSSCGSPRPTSTLSRMTKKTAAPELV
jgi:hypothetical protein